MCARGDKYVQGFDGKTCLKGYMEDLEILEIILLKWILSKKMGELELVPAGSG
jgi:hypothetical protein